MSVVAQFRITDSQNCARVTTDALSLSIERIFYKDKLPVLRTVVAGLEQETVHIEKVEIDDGEYITDYPIRVSVRGPMAHKPYPGENTSLYTPSSGVDQNQIFQECVGYMRLANREGLIKGAIHYRKR